MKCHGTSLHGQGEYEPEKKDLGESDQLEQNIKGEVKKCVVNTALFDQREVRI